MSEATKNASSKKRKYLDHNGGGKNNKRKWAMLTRPKRGAPGVLLTCETGREGKCQREGLEILNHYHSVSSDSKSNQDDSVDDSPSKEGSMSLEEELKLLTSKKGSSEQSSFGVYDTSCRGTIFVLCTLPNCNLIPAIQTEYMQAKSNAKNSDSTPDCKSDALETKIEAEGDKDRLEDASETNLTADCEKNTDDKKIQQPTPWDPISTVRNIMSDIDNDSNKEAPRSRFVTRMIPIQATCFASPEELQLTSLEVLKRYIPKSTKTFAITFKRRNCSNLDRNKVIKIIGDTMSEFFPDCKVNLSKPDATIMVEVCGTLCGMSVIENCKEYRNFNLMGAI